MIRCGTYPKSHTENHCDKCQQEIGKENLSPVDFLYKDMNDKTHEDVSETIGYPKGTGYRQYYICNKKLQCNCDKETEVKVKRKRRYNKEYARKRYLIDQKDICPNCGKQKTKYRNLCQKCFLEGLFKNKERNKKISINNLGKKSWCKGLTKYTDYRLNSTSEKHKNELNIQWKGDKVGYSALHGWVRRKLSKPLLCSECNKNSPYDLANISGEYKRDLNDWKWLCRKCHMKDDGRLKNLQSFKGSKQ